MLGYNIKIFHYEDGVQVRLYKRPVRVGYERLPFDKHSDPELDDFKDCPFGPVKKVANEKNDERSAYVSFSRSKQMIYGIARANLWEYFLTLTFDRKVTDSSNYRFVTKRATEWLNNIKKRYCPDLKYLIVPELHADGIHWHLHGLLANCSGLRFQDSGYKSSSGFPIYNLQNWRYGFSTVTAVLDTGRVSSYIVKYITKEMTNKIPGRQRYWASNNCFRPNDVYEHDYVNVSYDELVKKYSSGARHVSQRESLDGSQVITYIELGHE